MNVKRDVSLLSLVHDLFDPYQDGAFIIGPFGKIIEANPHGCEMFGYTHDEITALTLPDLINPEDLLKPPPVPFEELTTDHVEVVEQRMRRKDGSEFLGEVHGRKLVGDLTLGLVRDVTEQRNTQKALRLAEGRYRQLVETANEGIWTIDHNHRITYANSRMAAMLGYSPEEIIGLRFENFIFPEDMEDHKEKLANRRLGRSDFYQRRLRCKDGSVLWTMVSAMPDIDEDGNFIGSFSMHSDITSLKRAEAIQAARYHLLQVAGSLTLAEFLHETLESICGLTKSAGGIYQFIEADQSAISIQAWSMQGKHAVHRGEGSDMRIPIDSAGAFRRCVDSRQPLVCNDFASLPDQIERPAGHIELKRVLLAPVIRGTSVAAILGVSNKALPYDDNDVELVSSFADLTWDIAEKKLVEEALKRHERLLEEAQRIAQLGSYEIDTDTMTIAWSKEAYRILGFDVNHPTPTMAEFGRMIHPDDTAEMGQLFGHFLDTGEPLDTTYRIIRPDGEVRTVRSIAQPVWDAAGKMVKVMGTYQDVTDAKRMENNLRESEERFRSYVENANDVIFTMGPDGVFTYVSPNWTALIGHPLEEVIGQSMEVFVHPDDAPMVKSHIERIILHGERATGVEFRIRRKNGDWLWQMTEGAPLRNSDGVVASLVGISHDITERKRMEETLRASLAEKDVLLREVHHRVKNNLAAILGLLDLERQETDDHAAREMLSRLGNRIKSMSAVHEILYRSENLSQINFHDYLKSFISHLTASLTPSGGIACQVDATGIELRLDDAVPCGLIVNELVTNALKYAFPGGKPGVADETECKISVTMKSDGAGHTLTVADNGVGFPSDLNWRESSTLGLRLVQMLGEYQLGGRIDIDRSSGTKVTFVFDPQQRG